MKHNKRKVRDPYGFFTDQISAEKLLSSILTPISQARGAIRGAYLSRIYYVHEESRKLGEAGVVVP